MILLIQFSRFSTTNTHAYALIIWDIHTYTNGNKSRLHIYMTVDGWVRERPTLWEPISSSWKDRICERVFLCICVCLRTHKCVAVNNIRHLQSSPSSSSFLLNKMQSWVACIRVVMFVYMRIHETGQTTIKIIFFFSSI